MLLGDYLKQQHVSYIYKHAEIITEKDWVNDVLNPQLGPGEKLRYPSFNQWMNNERLPDVRNMVKLMKVFGPEVLTHLSVDFPPDLAKILERWVDTPEEAKQAIMNIIDNPEPVTLQT